MALHNFDGPSASSLQIKYLPGLVKQTKSAAVLPGRILIRMLNQVLSDVRVKDVKEKESSHLSSPGVTEQNLPRAGPHVRASRDGPLQRRVSQGIFSENGREEGGLLAGKTVVKRRRMVKIAMNGGELWENGSHHPMQSVIRSGLEHPWKYLKIGSVLSNLAKINSFCNE